LRKIRVAAEHERYADYEAVIDIKGVSASSFPSRLKGLAAATSSPQDWDQPHCENEKLRLKEISLVSTRLSEVSMHSPESGLTGSIGIVSRVDAKRSVAYSLEQHQLG
jgi:hypothetical protein